jgi:chloride channel protein, CIC family
LTAAAIRRPANSPGGGNRVTSHYDLPVLPLVRWRQHALVPVVVAGLAGGLLGAAYIALLHLVQRVLWPTHWDTWQQALILVTVGVTVAVITKLTGEPGTVELLVDNIHVAGGTDDVRSLRSLIPVSLLCIGAGGGLGPEAPLVQTTGTLASWLGRQAQLDRTQWRTVTITGMAAGFTVLFGAPLGGAVFALEILHRRGLEYYEALMPAVIGSLCGYATYVGITNVGLEPVWSFPSPGALHPADLLWAVGCGGGGAVVAVGFTFVTTALRALLARVPRAARPVLGGVGLAALGAVTPWALTYGEAQIGALTDGSTNLAVGALFLALGGKLLASALTLASGWKGGFIIPLFFMGVCVAQLTHHFVPSSNLWVLVPCLMVAANVGVTKTPIGSTLVVTEMAGLALLPTALIAAVVSLLLTSGVGLIETQRRREPA